jgi:hypothetical protein
MLRTYPEIAPLNDRPGETLLMLRLIGTLYCRFELTALVC